jgi:hypothetical protein
LSPGRDHVTLIGGRVMQLPTGHGDPLPARAREPEAGRKSSSRAVIAGHKVPDHDDDPRHIAATRQYLRDFHRLDQATDTPRELFDAMIERYPERTNPGSLSGAAKAAKPAAAKAMS